jgi:hypothetical protein
MLQGNQRSLVPDHSFLVCRACHRLGPRLLEISEGDPRTPPRGSGHV